MNFRAASKRQLLFLILFSFLYSLSIYADSQLEQPVLLLKEGESAFVPGTEIKIHVKSVIGLTSSGCMGGPVGCRDRVTIEIQSSKDNKVEAILESAKTVDQKKRKIDQTSIHGKTIRLIRLNNKEVELVVEDSSKDETDH